MVSLIIFGCIIMAYFFMAATTILKGISAFFDTMQDMAVVFAILLLGGVGILAIELIISLFGGGFWTLLITVAVIVVLFILFGSILSIIGSILLVVFEFALQIVLFVFGILDMVLEKLGEWCEKALKFFLGTINKKIVLS